VPSDDVEHCRDQAAKARLRAERASDPSVKKELLEIASYWDEIGSHYEAFERSQGSTS
jgi:hypothetical protein